MMKSEVLPATVLDGDNASPSVPAGTAGPKSKVYDNTNQRLTKASSYAKNKMSQVMYTLRHGLQWIIRV